MSKLFIPVLLGTSREGRQSEKVANYVLGKLEQKENVTTELVDPRKSNLPGDGHNEGSNDPAYSKIVKSADGFMIVTPEYNHSFPGSLKRMLDSELVEYKHKPANLVGVSSGPWGGVRAIQALVPVLRKMGIVVTSTDVMVRHSYQAFNEEGRPQDKDLDTAISKAIDELLWYAKLLKQARESKT